MSLETLAPFGHTEPKGYPPWPPDAGTYLPETTTVKLLLYHPLGHDPTLMLTTLWHGAGGGYCVLTATRRKKNRSLLP
jgi:hypothetical protein